MKRVTLQAKELIEMLENQYHNRFEQEYQEKLEKLYELLEDADEATINLLVQCKQLLCFPRIYQKVHSPDKNQHLFQVKYQDLANIAISSGMSIEQLCHEYLKETCELAKQYIRELAVDNVVRLEDLKLVKSLALLVETIEQRHG